MTVLTRSPTTLRTPCTASARVLRRGDRHRCAILTATADLLQEVSVSDLTVAAIPARAGITRSNFYFYFESKYGVLAAMLAEALGELSDDTRSFIPHAGVETPIGFVKRMVAAAEELYAMHSPVLAACIKARLSDSQLQAILDDQLDQLAKQIVNGIETEIAQYAIDPITDDVPMLVRILVATTAFTFAGDPAFGSGDDDHRRAVTVLESLWLRSLWSHASDGYSRK